MLSMCVLCFVVLCCGVSGAEQGMVEGRDATGYGGSSYGASGDCGGSDRSSVWGEHYVVTLWGVVDRPDKMLVRSYILGILGVNWGPER
jgi:hypothetical protein